MTMDPIRRLEIYRLESKISQQQLAEQLGVAYSTVNRWLNARTRPNQIQAYHIQKLLNESETKTSKRERRPSTEVRKKRGIE